MKLIKNTLYFIFIAFSNTIKQFWTGTRGNPKLDFGKRSTKLGTSRNFGEEKAELLAFGEVGRKVGNLFVPNLLTTIRASIRPSWTEVKNCGQVGYKSKIRVP